MAKDPAFLFYPGDWLGGTLTFNRSHKGAYMDLLMAQFNSGHLPLEDIETILGPDFHTMWNQKLKAKFKQDAAGNFFNERLEQEAIKRRSFTDSRKGNLKNKIHTETHMTAQAGDHMHPHMENENENRNKSKSETKEAKKNKKPSVQFSFADFNHPWQTDPEFMMAMIAFNDMRNLAKKPMTKYAADLIMKELTKLSQGKIDTAVRILNQSTKNKWMDVWPDKTADHMKQITRETVNDAYQKEAAKIQ